MKKIHLLSLSLFLTTILLGSQSFAHESEVIQSIKDCARTDDQSDRSSCYETLGRELIQADEAKEFAAKEAEAKQTQEGKYSEVLPESLGGGEYADKAGVKPTEYRGKVVSCQKAYDRKWFYIFDNKQVWKQIDSRKLRYRYGCDFKVTIYRGRFGYIMLIDDQEGKIQVKRHR